MTKILIIDDHRLARDGLRSLLSRDSTLSVVGEAGGAAEAIEKVAALDPDVVLMDLEGVGHEAIGMIRAIVAQRVGVRVVGLSSSHAHDHVRAAVDAGAVGYLSKTICEQELRRAIHTVVTHGAYLSPEVSAALVRPPETRRKTETLTETLTERERAVVRLVACGHTSKQIANELRLSPSTVETYRRNVAEKLGLRSVAEITRYAIRQGLASVE